jgi:hypothetical protein
MVLPVHVFPALRVRVVRHGRWAIARTSGGDGRILAYRWTEDGHPAGFTREIRTGPGARLRVSVSDGAGGVAHSGQAAIARRGHCS